MADQQFRRARALLPAVLARLSRERGAATPLLPVWTDVVGAHIAAHCRPTFLEGTVLVIEVPSPRWEAALSPQLPTILARLAATLGEGTVTALRFHPKEAK